jgi:hypothetical protein
MKRIRSAADMMFRRRMWEGNDELVAEALERVSAGKETPSGAAERLFDRIMNRDGS